MNLAKLAVVAAVLMCCARWSEAAEPKRLLLVGQGPDGHPAATHEFMAGLKVIEKCLADVKEIKITTVRADEPWREGPQMLKQADGVVHDLVRRRLVRSLLESVAAWRFLQGPHPVWRARALWPSVRATADSRSQ